MSPRRFVAAFALSAFAAAALVVVINVVVDPLGVVPGSRSVPGLNATKVKRFANDRTYKPRDLLSARPRTVVAGTSRILEGVRPSDARGDAVRPAYNYGLPSGNVRESAAHFERYMARTPSVKHVFVELFLPSAGPMRATPELLASSFFSWSTLEQSADTVWQNIRAHAGRAQPGPIVVADGRQSFLEMSTLTNFLVYPAAVLRECPRYEVTPRLLEAMRSMREVSRRHGITLTFFISPVHAVQLYTLYASGQWPVFEEWKRILARDFDVRDFSAYTPVVEEPVTNEMRYWLDPHHFSRLTGSMLAQRLIGAEPAADGFGVRLAPERIEDDLRAWRAARDAWIARFRMGRDLSCRPPRRSPRFSGAGRRAGWSSLSHPRLQRPARAPRAAASDPELARDLVPHDAGSPIEIAVRRTQAPGGDANEVCELAIGAAPETRSVRPVNWRIGHPMGRRRRSGAGRSGTPFGSARARP